MDRHLPEPGGLHTAVRDGGADQPVLAQTLRVDDVLPGLGRDVLAELSLVAGEELQERARAGWLDGLILTGRQKYSIFTMESAPSMEKSYLVSGVSQFIYVNKVG